MIEYRNISLAFNNQQLFDQFNLIIHEHEKVLLNAPSGSGKTSLVKMLLGLTRYEGEIFYNKKKLTHHTRNDFRKNISYVSQDVDLPNQIIRILIQEILSYKINKDVHYNEQDIITYLEKFNLKEEILDKSINNISGGERARIGLVIALLLDRPVLILDEITRGVDEELKKKMVDYILQLNKTVILISHDNYVKQSKNVRLVGWGHE